MFSFFPVNDLGKLARNLFLIGLFFHLLAAWFTVGYHHPDEYFQIVEFASYKLGKTPAGGLLWEFNAQIRPALQPAMVYWLYKMVTSNPVVITYLLRFISAIAAWIVAFLFVLISLKECRSDKTKKIILYLSAFLWFIPYIHARFSSENWSAIFFFAGLSMLILMVEPWSNLKRKTSALTLLLCGILFGLSFVTRFQSIFMIFGLSLWLLIYRKFKAKELLILCTGISIAVFLGAIADRWFYGKWVFIPFNYFDVNVLQGKSAGFGKSPWWDYFIMIIENTIPPFSIFIVAGIFIFFFRFPKHPLTWICVPFLLAHIVSPHKELRFLFPLINTLPLVIGFAFFEKTYSKGFGRLTQFFSSKFAVVSAKVFIALNILLMIIACIKPANEIFSFYNYMYEHYGHNKKTYLYTFADNPYNDLTVYFLRPENLTIIHVTMDSLAHNFRFRNDATNLVFEQSFEKTDSWHPAGKKISLKYQTIPEWIKLINFNNWLKQTRVWRVYTIE